IHGDGGNDIIFGDHGVIDQTAGTLRILTTGNVTHIATVNPALGGDDTISGDDGDDRILGGFGQDTISGNSGNDVVLGDDGLIDYATDGKLALVRSTDLATGSRDTIAGGDNVALDRSTGSDLNPRFRALQGTQMYSTATATAGSALVTSAEQAVPGGAAVWENFAVTLLDHSFADQAAALNNFGDDYIAGG